MWYFLSKKRDFPQSENDTLDICFIVVQGGDLFEAIVRATKYTEKDASHMIRDLAAALHYLHSMNVVHRDIKPENLLVSIHMPFKISTKCLR